MTLQYHFKFHPHFWGFKPAKIRYKTKLDSNEATFYIDDAFSKQPNTHHKMCTFTANQLLNGCIKPDLRKMMLFLCVAGEELVRRAVLPNVSFRAHIIRMTKIKHSQWVVAQPSSEKLWCLLWLFAVVTAAAASSTLAHIPTGARRLWNGNWITSSR